MNRMRVNEYKKWLRQVLQKEQLTTEEMAQILDGQLRLPAREMDAALIRKCRKALYPDLQGADMPGKQETLHRVRSFLQKEGRPEGTKAIESAGAKRHFFLRPAAFVSCVLFVVLLFGISINAVGFNVWDMIFHWNDESMKMEIAMQRQIKGREDHLGQSYDDAFIRKLAEMEMTPLLPSWMPDGFGLERVEGKIETEDYRWAVGNYTSGDMQLQISVFLDISGNFGGIWSLQKDEREPDIFEQGGIKFYIMDNLSRSRVFWYDPPYTISITGHVNREELRQMIDSIFERSI